MIFFCINDLRLYICSPKSGEISSAGSEHLPYKQGVTGSNPVSPTLLDRSINFDAVQFFFTPGSPVTNLVL